MESLPLQDYAESLDEIVQIEMELKSYEHITEALENLDQDQMESFNQQQCKLTFLADLLIGNEHGRILQLRNRYRLKDQCMVG